MHLSKMVSRIKPSLTRKLFDMASQYENVIDFTLGDPDYQTPNFIKDAAYNAIREGKTRYSANAGVFELRKVVADRVEKETGIKYNPDNEIMITVGAMEGIYLSLCCLIDPGDEVIIPAPYWINYRHMTEMLSGNPVLVEANDEHGFIVTAESVEKAITERTRAIIINSPNNPTGMVYDYDTLDKIGKLCKKHNIVMIFDECYKSIVYDGQKFVSILEIEGMKDFAIVVNSLSKSYAMTGWRIGYLVGPQEIVSNIPKIQENIVACATVPCQYAAIAALKSDFVDSGYMRDAYEKRRNVLVEGINKIDKLSCKYPKGTFYAFVNIKETGMTSEEFAYALLESEQVAVVPGITYGNCCEGYVRIAYTMDVELIYEGVNRIKKFIDTL